jgi:hypothetical protein
MTRVKPEELVKGTKYLFWYYDEWVIGKYFKNGPDTFFRFMYAGCNEKVYITEETIIYQLPPSPA